jgi:predicted nucleotidyltransferase component of viral defense system
LRKVISPPEFEVEDSEIQTMELEEIICEKVHAIYNRPKPRDLYDLWYLLGN